RSGSPGKSMCRGRTRSKCHSVLRNRCHLEDDDIVTELVHIHPRERPDWEETISAMARSAEIPELRAEPLMRLSSSSTASMKVKNVKKLSFTKGHFPKLAECAHFHYENVDFGTIQVQLSLFSSIQFPGSCSDSSGFQKVLFFFNLFWPAIYTHVIEGRPVDRDRRNEHL
uniref:RHG32 n=1 Tax=Oryzias latipes TaxID=8090 RepID=A0A3P9J5S2_ORYLA